MTEPTWIDRMREHVDAARTDKPKGDKMTKLNNEYVPKQVIENKLLAALDDEAKVACVFGCWDLDTLIEALRFTASFLELADQEKYILMAQDLETLRKSAFGK